MTDKEIQHEINMSRAGTDRVQRDLRDLQDKKYASKSSFGQHFLIGFTIPFASALKQSTKKPASRAVRTAIARGYRDMQTVFGFLESNLVSYICLTTLIDQYYVSDFYLPTTQEVARRIGSRIEDQLRIQYFTELAPDDVVSAMNKQLHTAGSSEGFMRSGAKHTAEKLLVNVHGWSEEDLFIDWSSRNRFSVGHFVLEVAAGINLINYFSKRNPRTNKLQGHYRLSDELQVEAIKHQTYIEERTVIKEPLVCTPKDWELQEGIARKNISGGYYQDWFKRDLNLCRGYTSDTRFGSEAINLLNTLGRTAWNIDKGIYDEGMKCLEKDISIGKFKAVIRDPIIDQSMPQNIVDKGKTDQEYKDWKSTKSTAIELHRQSINKARSSRISLMLAHKFIKEPRFYLSWSCDYRGRMYSQQPLLDQQKNDFQKALVIFADGCKLDESGKEYAAQALGAAFNGSKTAYEERSKWTYENDLIIRAVAEDPIRMSSTWEGCDEPWQFVQLCKEWNRVVLTKEKPLWNVAIGADATASGLQLLSAMRRDPKGMEFTNLLAPRSSSEPPRDAYKEVLRIARQMVYKNPETAWMVEHLEDRQLGKVVLMKKVYGAAYGTNRYEIKEEFIKQGKYPNPINKEALSQITNVLRDASKEVFPMAFQALTWIKKLIKAGQENGSTSFTWTTPNLDSIHLNKVEYETERIDSSFVGRISIPLDEVKNPNFTRMKSSIAPDFVHSYDAAVLKSAFQDWHKPLAVIHDQIKVLPNDMDTAKERIRKAFVHVCSGDPLARLADDLGVTAEQLPRLKQGTGRLEDVLDSAYMFN